MPQPMNGEVTIICLTDEVSLRDLGVRLTRGAKVVVPLSSAMNSRDLQRAKIDGTVSTQTLKASAIRVSEYTSSDTTTSRAPRHQPVPAPVVAPLPDMTPLFGMLQSLTEEVKALRAEVARRDTEVRVREVPVPVVASTVVPTVVAPEPVFIPTDLTGKGLKRPVLEVAHQHTETPGVEDAAAALKAARKPRSPR